MTEKNGSGSRRSERVARDYRIVYGEMKSYLWRFTAGDGMDIVAILADVLAGFEAAAAEGRPVLDITGEVVSAYCDARLGDANVYDRYLERWRDSLNQDVKKQLKC